MVIVFGNIGNNSRQETKSKRMKNILNSMYVLLGVVVLVIVMNETGTWPFEMSAIKAVLILNVIAQCVNLAALLFSRLRRQ